MLTIKFSYNWNNKLNCKMFTTWRLHNPKKYKVGQVYLIEAKGMKPFHARVMAINTRQLSQATDFIAGVDTGYSLVEFRDIVRKMYKEADQKLFDFILLKKETI